MLEQSKNVCKSALVLVYAFKLVKERSHEKRRKSTKLDHKEQTNRRSRLNSASF